MIYQNNQLTIFFFFFLILIALLLGNKINKKRLLKSIVWKSNTR